MHDQGITRPTVTFVALLYHMLMMIEMLMTVSIRVPTGQGKLEKVREFAGQGKSGKTLQFEDSTGKVRENKSTC